MENVDLNKYKEFVKEVTSEQSNNVAQMHHRMVEISEKVNPALLLTGAIGIASEGGESVKLLKNDSVNQWTMKLYFIVNENWAILCGIGLIVAVPLVWTLTKS